MKRTPLKPDPEKVRRWQQRSREKAAENARAKPRKPLGRSSGPKRKAPAKRRAPISAASPAQREKVRDAVSIISGQGPCDPAHIVSRAKGGCNDPLCVVALTRDEHRAYDQGDLDLLPHLIRARKIPELQHALAHADGSLLRLLERVTNRRWAPLGERHG